MTRLALGSNWREVDVLDEDVDLTADKSGSPHPWRMETWRSTAEMHKIVDEYLSSKTLQEQIELAKLMRECEAPLPKPRQAKTTENIPWLQSPGADRRIAAEWHARLSGGAS